MCTGYLCPIEAQDSYGLEAQVPVQVAARRTGRSGIGGDFFCNGSAILMLAERALAPMVAALDPDVIAL